MLNAPFYLMRNAQKIQFLENIVGLGSGFDLSLLTLENEFTTVATKLIVVNAGFKPTLASDLTEQIVTIDTERDNALKFISQVLNAYDYHHEEVKRAAARKIQSIFNKYGSRLYSIGYVEETKVINAICDELAEESVEAQVALIGLTDEVSQLQTLNTNFDSLWLDRIKEQSENNTEPIAESLKEAIAAYMDLQTKINALFVITPSEELTSLYNQIDELCTKYRSL